jgi:penicillin-binding protein 1A
MARPTDRSTGRPADRPSRRPAGRPLAAAPSDRPRGSGRTPTPAAARGPAKRRGWFGWLAKWTLILAVWGALGVAGVLLWFGHDLPRPEAALDAWRRPSLTLQDRAGQTFATFGDVVGEPLRLPDMPRALPDALIAVEDRRFRSHFGVDPIGLARAAWVNISSGRVAQGGSRSPSRSPRPCSCRTPARCGAKSRNCC